MEFVDDQREVVVRGRFQPRACLLEEVGLQLAHQHHVEHGYVGDEDVRRRLEHVPAGEHLAAPGIGELATDLRVAGREAAGLARDLSDLARHGPYPTEVPG